VIVLDTHALLWWALDPDRLSDAARATVAEMERRGGYASAISLWELGIKIQRGKLEIGIPIEELARRLDSGGVVQLLPVDAATWLQSLALDWVHRDPADRVIVATALRRSLPIVTAEQEIQRYPGVTCIW
jgi:PIN domain nuclease of toxin-antitoxin system